MTVPATWHYRCWCWNEIRLVLSSILQTCLSENLQSWDANPCPSASTHPPAKLPSSSLLGVCVPLVASLYHPALLNVAEDMRSIPMSENSLFGVPGSSPPPLMGARRRDMRGFGVRSTPLSSTTCVVLAKHGWDETDQILSNTRELRGGGLTRRGKRS